MLSLTNSITLVMIIETDAILRTIVGL